MVLAVPAKRVHDDQGARIEQFAAQTACELVKSLDPVDFARQICEALTADRARNETVPWLEALDQLGESLLELARRDGTVLQGLSEQFRHQ